MSKAKHNVLPKYRGKYECVSRFRAQLKPLRWMLELGPASHLPVCRAL